MLREDIYCEDDDDAMVEGIVKENVGSILAVRRFTSWFHTNIVYGKLYGIRYIQINNLKCIFIKCKMIFSGRLPVTGNARPSYRSKCY